MQATPNLESSHICAGESCEPSLEKAEAPKGTGPPLDAPEDPSAPDVVHPTSKPTAMGLSDPDLVGQLMETWGGGYPF